MGKLSEPSEFVDDSMRFAPQRRKHIGRCRCECHSGVGSVFRCDHCFAYAENDWSPQVSGREPVSRQRVEFRIRG